jgi:hypothetical protein
MTLDQETLEKNVALLAQAEKSLVEVRATLNNNSSVCEGCNKIAWENWEEHINYDSLEGTLVKIRRHIGLFKTWLKLKENYDL